MKLKHATPDTPVHAIVFNYGYHGEDVTKDNIHGEVLGYVIGPGHYLNSDMPLPNSAKIYVTHFRYNVKGDPWITEPDRILLALDEVHIRGAEFDPKDMSFTDMVYNFTDVTHTVLKILTAK